MASVSTPGTFHSMSWSRQTVLLLARCKNTLHLALSTSRPRSQRCFLSGGLRRLMSGEAPGGGDRARNGNQFAENSVTLATEQNITPLGLRPNTGAGYVRLVEQQLAHLTSWEAAAFLFNLLEALRLAQSCLSDCSNPELDLLISFLSELESETAFLASKHSGHAKSTQQLPRKIVKLPKHFFVNDSKEPKVQIFPELPFYVSPTMASAMKESMASDNWKDFVTYFLEEIYGDDLVYLTAMGWKNTQGIHPLILRGLVDFASRKNSNVSESDVKVLINAIIGSKKICHIKARRRKVAVNYESVVKTSNNSQFDAALSTCPPHTCKGADYIQLVEQEIRHSASEKNLAFVASVLESLKTTLATEINADLSFLVSFLDALVSETEKALKEKENFRSCRQIPQKTVKLPNHYFVNDNQEKIPKVQIFFNVPFFVSPALASIMEDRKNNWKSFVQKFLECIYGDDLVHLAAQAKGEKQGIHPYIFQGLADLAMQEDKSVSQVDVARRINQVTSNKRISFKRRKWQ